MLKPTTTIFFLAAATASCDALAPSNGGDGGGSLAKKIPQRITFAQLLSSTTAAVVDNNNDGTKNAANNNNDNDLLLLDALTKDGYISITDIYSDNNNDDGGKMSFREVKHQLMSNLDGCLMDILADYDTVADAPNIMDQLLDDGTVRRSFATVTLPSSSSDGTINNKGSLLGGGLDHQQMQQQPIHLLEEYIARHPNKSSSLSCHAFHEQLANFRSTIAKTTIKFATRLSTELSMISSTTMNDDDDLFKLPTPLLMSSSSSTNDYKDFASVVMGGEHLEHFHSYQKSSSVTTNGRSGSNGRKEGDSSSSDSGMPTPTIQLHTDQGLFIAFTPGLIATSNNSSNNNNQKKIMELSEGFYVQDSITGENVLLEFTQDDDLVFMLGDGVNDLINNQLHQQKNKGGDDENETTKKMMVPPLLRATPHALSLSSYHDGDYDDASVARVWYGLMVLPPSDAYVPNTSNNKDNNNKMMTYGQLRQVFVESSSNGEDYPMGIGCSSRNSRMVINTSRSLGEGEGNEEEEEEEGHGLSSNQCADNELFCWFRCQALDEETSTCEERNLGLQCVNPRMQVLPDGAGHGDYFPACTNNTHITHPVTDYPEIDQQDPDVCTVDQWDEFNVRDDYTHVVSLNPSFSKGLGPDARLSWTIVESDDGTKKVKARFAYDDVFGFLAIGFANIFDTVHNGMNGGKILLMKPGGDYSPVTGLDLSQAPSIGSYVIDDKDSAFRHWVDTEMVVDDATHEHTDCFTALTFESDNIGGQEFNLDGEGTDELIWAGNSKDYFVGYHGPFTRARFTINWLTGDVKFFVPDAQAWGSDEVEEDGNHASSSEAVEDDGDLAAPQASDEVVEVGDLAASTVGTLDYSSAFIAHASFGVTFAIICIVFL